MFVLLLFVFALSIISDANSQPDDYKPKGTKSYLVNYGAVRTNPFLTKLAYKRFAFLDEAYQKEIDFIRRFDKNYLILFYKDVVALNNYLPEYKKMILEEDAFLHTSEPASLTVAFENGWKFYWMPDRRFDTTVKVSYRLYWGFDSSGTFNPVDTVVKATELKVSLPKSARWVLLKSLVNDTLEIPYSFPVQLYYSDNEPLYVPLRLVKKASSGDNTTTFRLEFKSVGGVLPDSVYLYADIDKDNAFNEKPIVFNSNLDTISFYNYLNNNYIRAGVELYLICFKEGKQYRLPKVGYWTTNPNNRIKNEEYDFFVMDVGNKKWLKNYIEQVERAFTRGYNGLFMDDTWYRVSNWGVDAYPPLNYNDSIWYMNIIEFLTEVNKAIGDKPMYFNGLFTNYALGFLEIADGGMDEGFAFTHWSGYVGDENWINACNRGLQCQNTYNKVWLPLGGIQNLSPKARLYCLSSYLLCAGEKSYFANATNYQTFAHFPEFDIPIGQPKESAKYSITELAYYDAKGRRYFKREFTNCTVYVNPSRKDTVYLPELQNAPMVFVDSALSIQGARLYTIKSDSILYPLSAKIILKPNTRLSSPAIKNPKVKISGKGKDYITVEVQVECADSSSQNFLGNKQLSLYVYADLSELGILEEIVLQNDGTSANPNFSTYFGEITIPPGAKFKNIEVPIVALSTTGLMTIVYTEPELENLDFSNLVPNFSFEYDSDFDDKPDFWQDYRNGYIYDTNEVNAQHLKRCIKVVNNTPLDTGGAYSYIFFDNPTLQPILISGWSKAENVSGSADYNYSIYVDFFSDENIPWYGRVTRFSTGTHDWEYSATIHKPPFPILFGNVYCLFRGHSGTVWFDNIFVGEVDTTETFVDEESETKIRVPSLVSGQESDVIIVENPPNEIIRITIYNTLADKIYEGNINTRSDVEIVPLYMLVKGRANGAYFVRLDFNNRTYVFPFLVVR